MPSADPATPTNNPADPVAALAEALGLLSEVDRARLVALLAQGTGEGSGGSVDRGQGAATV